jgi:hypothetical protein
MYNFLEFNDLSASLVSNGDISSDTAWIVNDTAPIGDNDDAWAYSTQTYQTEAFGGDWTNGLSQEVTIKKNTEYLFKVQIQSGNANDVKFYVLLVSGSNYVTLHEEIINNETKFAAFNYKPTSNYEKIMVVAFNEGGGGTFIGRVLDFNVYKLACDYAMPLIAEDVVKGYTNFDIDDTVIPFADLKLGLFDDSFYLYDIATLTQVVVSGDIYNVHFEWTVPVLPKGNFRFVLYEDTNEVHYISNVFRYTANDLHTSIIKYRNTKNTLDYEYETATTFYNQFRIDLWEGRANWPEKSRGYETYEGGFIRTKSDIQKEREFKYSFASEGVLEAFTSALLHDEVYLDDIEFIKADGQSLTIEWGQDELEIGTGTISLQEVSYSKSIESC